MKLKSNTARIEWAFVENAHDFSYIMFIRKYELIAELL